MSRTLKAGTVIHLAGSNHPMVLPSDTKVDSAGFDNDATFIGHLHRNAENFTLNAPGVGTGRWNPVTAAPMLAECETCGADIPASAEDQTTCAQCLNVAALKEAQAKADKETAKEPAPKKATQRSKAAKK